MAVVVGNDETTRQIEGTLAQLRSELTAARAKQAQAEELHEVAEMVKQVRALVAEPNVSHAELDAALHGAIRAQAEKLAAQLGGELQLTNEQIRAELVAVKDLEVEQMRALHQATEDSVVTALGVGFGRLADKVDARADELGARVGAVDGRLGAVNDRLGAVGDRLGAVDEGVVAVGAQAGAMLSCVEKVRLELKALAAPAQDPFQSASAPVIDADQLQKGEYIGEGGFAKVSPTNRLTALNDPDTRGQNGQA